MHREYRTEAINIWHCRPPGLGSKTTATVLLLAWYIAVVTSAPKVVDSATPNACSKPSYFSTELLGWGLLETLLFPAKAASGVFMLHLMSLYGRHRIISSADATFSAANVDVANLFVFMQHVYYFSLHNDRTSGGENYLLDFSACNLLARGKPPIQITGSLPVAQKCRCRQGLFKNIDGFHLKCCMQLKITMTFFV